MSESGQSKNDILLLVNKRLERFACTFTSLLSYLSDLTQTKTERLVIYKRRRGMENGEWKIENGEWRMENGKWKMGMGNNEWKM